MCIRDSINPDLLLEHIEHYLPEDLEIPGTGASNSERLSHCLLYTSDAADEQLCVDLGGRSSIKKKKHIINFYQITYFSIFLMY